MATATEGARSIVLTNRITVVVLTAVGVLAAAAVLALGALAPRL